MRANCEPNSAQPPLYCFVAFHSAKLNFCLFAASRALDWPSSNFNKKAVGPVLKADFALPDFLLRPWVSLVRDPSVFVYVTGANFELVLKSFYKRKADKIVFSFGLLYSASRHTIVETLYSRNIKIHMHQRLCVCERVFLFHCFSICGSERERSHETKFYCREITSVFVLFLSLRMGAGTWLWSVFFLCGTD